MSLRHFARVIVGAALLAAPAVVRAVDLPDCVTPSSFLNNPGSDGIAVVMGESPQDSTAALSWAWDYMASQSPASECLAGAVGIGRIQIYARPYSVGTWEDWCQDFVPWESRLDEFQFTVIAFTDAAIAFDFSTDTYEAFTYTPASPPNPNDGWLLVNESTWAAYSLCTFVNHLSEVETAWSAIDLQCFLDVWGAVSWQTLHDSVCEDQDYLPDPTGPPVVTPPGVTDPPPPSGETPPSGPGTGPIPPEFEGNPPTDPDPDPDPPPLTLLLAVGMGITTGLLIALLIPRKTLSLLLTDRTRAKDSRVVT